MINIAIVGYGNLGKAVEAQISQHPDLNCIGIFSRRENLDSKIYPSYHYEELFNSNLNIDVCILCGSSEKDLQIQTAELAQYYNCIDSFDIHSLIPQHLKNVHANASKYETSSIVSVGWDPGLFSLQRLIFEAIMPQGKTETFWGKGVSQGHSNAIKTIEGVIDAIQYTIPNEEVMAAVRRNEDIDPSLKHERHCYVCANKEDQERIKNEIINMSHYFKGQKTIVNFITEEEMLENHQGMPHGGHVIRSAESNSYHHNLSFELALENNPNFTAAILIACSRAVYRLNKEGRYGAFTIFDLSMKDMSINSREDLIKRLL